MRLILAALNSLGFLLPNKSIGRKNADVNNTSQKGVINWNQGTILAPLRPFQHRGPKQNQFSISANSNTNRAKLLRNALATAQSLRIDHTISVLNFAAEIKVYLINIRGLITNV